MAAESRNAALVGDREIRGACVFDAPRELVWKAWEHIEKWCTWRCRRDDGPPEIPDFRTAAYQAIDD